MTFDKTWQISASGSNRFSGNFAGDGVQNSRSRVGGTHTLPTRGNSPLRGTAANEALIDTGRSKFERLSLLGSMYHLSWDARPQTLHIIHRLCDTVKWLMYFEFSPLASFSRHLALMLLSARNWARVRKVHKAKSM
ncbi:uncharacterized protein LAJ45_08399 [Morchella importuna]|uniref:uncharacterized protein n=1 Tax=Morchella importuna TaxID=1174673 RepID=UPI001E8EDB3B|nr:uncharacterized protein LAJ45_08399 [Morchella importuna]KAH8147572.1 hypothetical protein LAJ45_08399 [Morchella importuna]